MIPYFVLQDKNVKIIRELREEIERLKAMVGGDIVSTRNK
jgi:hypothetical protein